MKFWIQRLKIYAVEFIKKIDNCFFERKIPKGEVIGNCPRCSAPLNSCTGGTVDQWKFTWCDYCEYSSEELLF